MTQGTSQRAAALPFRIGLTGGIGSGKSRVADQLGELGADIIDTDLIAHQLTQPAGRAIAPLREAFGDQIIDATGALDRAAMREQVFRDSTARLRLEGILHPLIGEEVQRQADIGAGLYQVFVVPLLVESGRWRERVDRICVVDCDEATQITRVGLRSGLAPADVQRIMEVQASRQARLDAADDVIVNDGATTPGQLRERVLAMHAQWLRMLAREQPA